MTEERLPFDTDLYHRFAHLEPLFASRSATVYLAADAEDRPYLVLDERKADNGRKDPLLALCFSGEAERAEWVGAVYAGARAALGGEDGGTGERPDCDGGAGCPVAPRPVPVLAGPAARTFAEAAEPPRNP